MTNATIGHNSDAGKALASYIERLETANEAVKDAQSDVKDLFTEVKSAGFDTKIVKKILRIKAMDKAKREEEEALTETYLHALGLL